MYECARLFVFFLTWVARECFVGVDFGLVIGRHDEVILNKPEKTCNVVAVQDSADSARDELEAWSSFEKFKRKTITGRIYCQLVRDRGERWRDV